MQASWFRQSVLLGLSFGHPHNAFPYRRAQLCSWTNSTTKINQLVCSKSVLPTSVSGCTGCVHIKVVTAVGVALSFVS